MAILIRGGKLVIKNGNKPAFPVSELCPGECTTHTGEAGVAPSIQLTMSDAGYSGGNQIWCGITWLPAEIISGTTKCACPTYYSLGQRTAGNPLNSPLTCGTSRGETWINASTNRMELFRFAASNIGACGFLGMDRFVESEIVHAGVYINMPNWFFELFHNVGGADYTITNRYNGGPPTYATGFWGAFYTGSTFATVAAVNAKRAANASRTALIATKSNYRIANDFFQSFTVTFPGSAGNGITYTVARGDDWV